MDLPFGYEEALREWKRFEEYLVQARYALRDPETGTPLEKNISDVTKRVSSAFKHPDVRKAVTEGRIMTATPFLMNGANPFTRRSGYYSCYPLGHVEDSTDSIFAMERDLVTIFQHAGGGGIDVSKLRSKGSLVDNGQGTASGPVSFAKGFSHLSARISQGGKRRGALMIQADWDIKDIREYVTFKGDNPGKYSGCNVSVNVTSEQFWEDEDLVQLIAEYIWKSGDPGLLFIQKSLENTPVPVRHDPVFSNPCGEYLSTKDTACNLLTVNLAKCLGATPAQYLENVYKTALLAAIAGNEILDLGGFPPIERIKKKTLEFRPIGIGFTGLHHAMNQWHISYADDEKAPLFTMATQLALMLGSMQGSFDFAEFSKQRNGQELEPREWNMAYAGSLEEKVRSFIESTLFTSLADETEDDAVLRSWISRSDTIFSQLQDLGGLYNSVTTSQAPTGSISQLMHIASTGIEPYYAMVQVRRVRDQDDSWREFTLVPLEFYSYDEEKLSWVEAQTAYNIEPYQQIRILEACQTFNHTAVSKTVNLPAQTSVDEIKDILLYARKSNLKGITIFRDTSITGVLADFMGEGWSVGNFTDLDERLGSTFKFKGPSPLYITANRGEEGHLREVFLNTTKSGSTIHGMSEALGRVISVTLQHDYRLIRKIARTLEDISSDTTWFNGKLGRVYSIPAALAKILEFYAKKELNGEPEPYTGPSAYSACPACGKLTLCRSGGCSQCVSCGFSSC